MKKIGCVISLLLCTLFSLSLNSQEIAKQYFTKQINPQLAPKLDGFLDDSIWDKVEWGSNFVEVSPDENTSPTEDTKFKILFDQKYLYVALLALDSSPNSITQRLSRRDGFEGDRINVLIDSYHDLRTAFLFTVTAAGVRGDEITVSYTHLTLPTTR